MSSGSVRPLPSFDHPYLLLLLFFFFFLLIVLVVCLLRQSTSSPSPTHLASSRLSSDSVLRLYGVSKLELLDTRDVDLGAASAPTLTSVPTHAQPVLPLQLGDCLLGTSQPRDRLGSARLVFMIFDST